jgi:hypothetical protein
MAISDRLPATNVSNTPLRTPVPLSNQMVTSDYIDKQKLAAIALFQSYKFNMSEWQRKLPSDLVYILDPNFPEQGNSRDEVKRMMSKNDQLVYADEAIKIFGLLLNANHPVGDQVHVYVDINSSMADQDIDSYLTKVTRRQNLTITAWADLNNLKQLASLKAVRNIRLVFPADFG